MKLYTVCATLFRRFPKIKLYRTTKEDVETVHDYFAVLGRGGRVGLQVLVE